MWQLLIQRIPENQLPNWFGWLTFLAVIIPLIGGLCGWAAWKVGDRVSELKETSYELKLSAAQREAASARELAVDVKAHIEPRSVSSEQKAVLHAELKQAADAGLAQVPIVIASRMMDQESLKFGREIIEVLGGTGWEIRPTEMSTHSFPGIAVFYQPEGQASAACQAIQAAFKKANIPFTTNNLDVKRTPIQLDHAIYVIVGHK